MGANSTPRTSLLSKVGTLQNLRHFLTFLGLLLKSPMLDGHSRSRNSATKHRKCQGFGGWNLQQGRWVRRIVVLLGDREASTEGTTSKKGAKTRGKWRGRGHEQMSKTSPALGSLERETKADSAPQIPKFENYAFAARRALMIGKRGCTLASHTSLFLGG